MGWTNNLSYKETQEYKELKKLTNSLNELIDSVQDTSKRSVINPRGFNMSLIEFRNGEIRPSIEGVRVIAKQLNFAENISH